MNERGFETEIVSDGKIILRAKNIGRAIAYSEYAHTRLAASEARRISGNHPVITMETVDAVINGIRLIGMKPAHIPSQNQAE